MGMLDSKMNMQIDILGPGYIFFRFMFNQVGQVDSIQCLCFSYYSAFHFTAHGADSSNHNRLFFVNLKRKKKAKKKH